MELWEKEFAEQNKTIQTKTRCKFFISFLGMREVIGLFLYCDEVLGHNHV